MESFIFYPSLEKLNYVTIWTVIDEKEYLLDATDELLPLGMLPKRCLNERGDWLPKNQISGLI